MENLCSIVEIFDDESSGHSCGYCKSTNGSKSYGMWAHSMTVLDYQDLLDRGWRRSGKYCYKPTMSETCCPLYTIKCDANELHLSKSQKKVLKKVNRFLNQGTTHNTQQTGPKSSHTMDEDQSIEDGPHFELVDRTAALASQKISAKSLNPDEKHAIRKAQTESVPSEPNPQSSAAVGIVPKKPACKKAKLIRLERRLQKEANKTGKPVEKLKLEVLNVKHGNEKTVKSLEDFLKVQLPENSAHNFDIRLVRTSPPSDECNKTFDTSYALYRKYQIIIHKDTPTKCSPSQFRRFLVDSPLEYEECLDGPQHGYGSFHQQYWLDGKLIAVGVVDLLPKCVSSVYFYYDPDYSFLSMGTYASLREISFTRHLSRDTPRLRYYYMGFYIHTCPKMTYKGQYKPSYLLCPETYTWHRVEEVQPQLDRKKYVRFGSTGQDERVEQVTAEDVQVLHERRAVKYSTYRANTTVRSYRDDRADVEKYAKLVGKDCAQRMLLYRA